jgi:hypothetical protein
MHAIRFGRGTHPSPPSALWVLLSPPFGLCEALSVFCESRERSLKSSSFGAFDLPAGIVTDIGGLRVIAGSESGAHLTHLMRNGTTDAEGMSKPLDIGGNVWPRF